ncbi:potassium channel family protein [Candidatus Contubernalis alkaliaceticus]|uniref:potassium channel family protein n=1 Tax=Candidatus Contubernalis alkaliaceticus TaxID=338645 RepID=UPI001F4C48A3|nr:TrkA family potassium uptake protein [Candidatus Contubernalis alkalaceticus]UNC92254.1 TrkA family potassium uptake protein [Candidatus Contubernalis alkalaceticus]
MKIILVGGGKVIYFLTKTFLSKGYEVVIINKDKEDSEQIARKLEVMVICGDGADPAYLEDAGANDADVVVALTPFDPENLMICNLAKKRFNVPRTFALVNDPAHEQIFLRLGVTSAFSTATLLSSLVEQQVSFDNITHLIPLEAGKITMTEVILDEKCPSVGSCISDLGLPQDSILATVIRKDDILIPKGSTCLQAGDKVVIISLPKSQSKMLNKLCGPDQRS